MSAVWVLASSEIRRRWRKVVVLALLVGAVGGVALATAAGARRTSSALQRFNATSRAATVQLQAGSATAAQLRALGKVPQVSSFGAVAALAVQDPAAPNLTIVTEQNTQVGTVVDRARVLAGRVANPAAVDEVAIDESVVAQIHKRIGDELDLVSYSPKQMHEVMTGGAAGSPAGPRLRLRIVGIIRRPFDLGRRGTSGGITILTPAFYRAYVRRIGTYPVWSVRIRTRDGRPDIPQITAAASHIFGPSARVTNPNTEAGGAQDAIDVLTIALWILAAVVATAGAVAIGMVLTREVSLPGFDQDTLGALGMTRSQRLAVAAPQAAVIAIGGATVAVIGAIVASGLFPIGIARIAEPDPGLRVDWKALLLGFVAISVIVLAIELVAAVRSTRAVAPEADAPISRRVTRAAAAVGLAPTTANGLRMALERGRGRSAVPIRSAVVAAAIGVFGVTAIFVFASSLTHLVTSPHRYGWTADFSAPENTAASANSCIHNDYGLLKEPGVGALASVCEESDNIELDGHATTGWSVSSLRGSIEPAVIAGRAPETADEVALGAATLHTLGKRIGDTVRATGTGAPGPHRYSIVGQVVLPSLGQIQPLADGAVFTGPGFAPLFDPNNYSRYLLGDFTRNANRVAVEHWIATNPDFSAATLPSVPVEIARIHQIDWLPATLAIVLAVLAAIAVGHALVTSVHRRRRELALLKTLGFKRAQVRTTVAWQAVTLATIALIVGLPLGLIAGRVFWRLIADSLGVAATPTVPTLVLVLVIPATIAIANLIAFVPARTAAHTRPAVALRAE